MILLKKIKYLFVLLSLCIPLRAHDDDKLEKEFLGFGWVVGVSVDLVFVPSDRFDKLPTIEDYFNQTNKYGLRVNEEENAIEALNYSRRLPIKWRDNEEDSIDITPVIASYTLYDKEYSVIKRDTGQVHLAPYHQMNRIYYYNNEVDTVTYRFGIDFELDLKVIR
jgi:hypothetical protein